MGCGGCSKAKVKVKYYDPKKMQALIKRKREMSVYHARTKMIFNKMYL